MRLKHICQGITVSHFGASIWLFFYLNRIYEGSDRIIVVVISTFFGLVMSCVYVVPLGAVLGLVIPSFCSRNSLTFIVIGVVLTATVVAGLTSLLVAAIFELEWRSVFCSMWMVSVALIFGWAILVRRTAPPGINR